jgi:hypothetical protein
MKNTSDSVDVDTDSVAAEPSQPLVDDVGDGAFYVAVARAPPDVDAHVTVPVPVIASSPVHEEEVSPTDPSSERGVSDRGWRVSIPTSAVHGSEILRARWMRSRAYARVYYSNAVFWKRIYYLIQSITIALNVGAALASLVEDNSDAARYVAGAANIIAGSAVAMATILNPGEETKANEQAGDDYADMASKLGTFDQAAASHRRITRLVREVLKREHVLRIRHAEPPVNQIEKRVRHYEDEARRSQHRLAHRNVPPVSERSGSRAPLERRETIVNFVAYDMV